MNKNFFCGFAVLVGAIFVTSYNFGNIGSKPVKPIETSAGQIVAAMNFGWNMGNTLDADDSNDLTSETSWGQTKTTKAAIDGLAASGIKSQEPSKIMMSILFLNH